MPTLDPGDGPPEQSVPECPRRGHVWPGTWELGLRRFPCERPACRSSEEACGTVLDVRWVRAGRSCLAVLLAAPKAAVLSSSRVVRLPAEGPVMHPNPPRRTFGYEARDAVPVGA